ncbi:hypothetical protein JCM4814A_81610 [Streptomyces phaeofaciens JCM 4814]
MEDRRLEREVKPWAKHPEQTVVSAGNRSGTIRVRLGSNPTRGTWWYGIGV